LNIKDYNGKTSINEKYPGWETCYEYSVVPIGYSWSMIGAWGQHHD
jgi:hypothetical protein